MPAPFRIVGELRVFDEFGHPIGAMPNVKAINLAWKRNGAAAATFIIPGSTLRYSTAYAREFYRVEYHSSQLPVVWTGVMLDVPPLGGEAAVNCMSAEYLYGNRFTDYWLQAIGDGGAIAMQLHQQAIRKQDLGIQLGAIDRSGAEYYVLYQLKQIDTALNDLAVQNGADWWVEKTGHRHLDPWQFRWSTARGSNRSDQVVLSGAVVDKPAYKRTGAGIKTFAYVLGGGISTNLWDRIKLEIPDPVAMEIYGRQEAVLEFKDIIDLTLLREAGVRALSVLSKPAKTIGVNLDNRFENIGQFWLADTIRLILAEVDWTGLDRQATVEGIQLDLDAQKMGLVVEIVS